jgi:transcription initiation factor IIE alpha subunit
MGNKISEKFVLTNEGIIKIKTPKRRSRVNVYNTTWRMNSSSTKTRRKKF